MSALPPPIFRELMKNAQGIMDKHREINERLDNADPNEWRTMLRMLNHVRKQDDGRSDALDKACHELAEVTGVTMNPENPNDCKVEGVRPVQYDGKQNALVYKQDDLFDKDTYYAFKDKVRSILKGEQLTPNQVDIATGLLASAALNVGAASDYFQKVEEAMKEASEAAQQAGRSAAVH